MFWNRYREAAIVGLSLLAGIVLTVLAFLNLLTPGALIPALGAGFGALCLWIAAFVSASPLRQNPEYGRCVCLRALRTAIGALALMGVSALTLALLPPAAWLLLILLFLIFTLGVYAALSLASLLGCLAWGGRTARG
ncbi:MAG: hypothetical protein MR842_09260 [Clostridiales bacterium]|nr:hypothetical protein [Clostridiales bacterium]MCI6377928.1 hypothetical protein [Clostridiales bacterium]MDO4351074.1 hypothetical protein [Eubacteriales bacterium]MDY4007544.1 hypothetical protein [Candidatus Limiplasma sp.]